MTDREQERQDLFVKVCRNEIDNDTWLELDRTYDKPQTPTVAPSASTTLEQPSD